MYFQVLKLIRMVKIWTALALALRRIERRLPEHSLNLIPFSRNHAWNAPLAQHLAPLIMTWGMDSTLIMRIPSMESNHQIICEEVFRTHYRIHTKYGTTGSQCTVQWSSSLGRGWQNCTKKIRSLFNGYVTTYGKRTKRHVFLYAYFSLFGLETQFITKFPYFCAFFELLKLI